MTRKGNRSRAQRRAAKQAAKAVLLEKQNAEEAKRSLLRRKLDIKRRLKKLGKDFTDKLVGGLSQAGLNSQSDAMGELRDSYDEIVGESTDEEFCTWQLSVLNHSKGGNCRVKTAADREDFEMIPGMWGRHDNTTMLDMEL